MNDDMRAFAHRMRVEFPRFLMQYRFAVDEMLTKVSILREEFLHLHRYNPIEHVSSRVKSPQSLLEKMARRGVTPDLDQIRSQITDIAGIRITCSFIADTYRVLETLTSQDDVRVLEIKDYIAHPKPTGYKSLHAILEVPVFLSNGAVPVICEVQIRTIAMDFWASLEHKIQYKYQGEIPERLVHELTQASDAAAQLDRQMERLYAEVHGDDPADDAPGVDDDIVRRLWDLARRG
ncbi:GTP pyrophosphokinase family protein [Microbacterium sp. MPKO10]|uniref:GTP pyrophosphokinase n=1 Tax=Microbacterium sp. MPKO10 TaxID=2989818 RepID=UPI0022357AB0|nr:GTP pyrophosphokinase family protein [Microbacterium sp. MPKO10]MCW4457515.1 GTP pyrophosphokinase family protein [Microbacterium sp. MPKO10]